MTDTMTVVEMNPTQELLARLDRLQERNRRHRWLVEVGVWDEGLCTARREFDRDGQRD